MEAGQPPDLGAGALHGPAIGATFGALTLVYTGGSVMKAHDPDLRAQRDG